MPRRRPQTLATLALAAIVAAGCSSAPTTAIFYREHTVGSQSTFDPLSSSLQYVLDGAQVPSFETDDYARDLGKVLDHLGSPWKQIEEGDGFRRFVNAEVFPIEKNHLDESPAILPNVFLHMLGGGMLYRKQAEWFAARGSTSPYLLAGTLAMATEILAEAIEKPAANDTDEIADVYLFRPLGLWLYSDDDRAKWIQDTLDPVDWPNQLIWDVRDEQWRNIGMNYVFRPPWPGSESTRLFAYAGMTTLGGLSHELPNGDTLSWGGGAATMAIDPIELRWSAGLFYERDRSLLASIVVHGAEGYAVRANLYPGVIAEPGSWLARTGFFVGVTDDGQTTAGVQWWLPIGIGG